MSHWDDGYYGTQDPKPRKPEPVESTNQWAGLAWWTSIFDTEKPAETPKWACFRCSEKAGTVSYGPHVTHAFSETCPLGAAAPAKETT